jgi:FlaA1/EpsC-like NDP-sugar epimerase
VGAGEAGILVLKEMKRRTFSDVVGFIDDNQSKVHSHIYGTKVLGTTNDIKKIVKTYDIEEIIIAIPSVGGRTIRNIISKCEKTEVKIKTIPGLNEILTGEVAIKRIRDVRPEDLLGRETVQINTEDVNSFIRGKTVLVTGAGGTIGSELCRQIAKFNPEELILYDHNENDTYFLKLEISEKYPYLRTRTIIGDINDVDLLKYTFSKYCPRIIFHSAAHKHVPLMEENPTAAIKNNVTGTRNLMHAAEHYGVESFVMISTDKAVNPTSVMGSSKRITEMMMQAMAKTAKTKFMAVRFGNVIGSSGSVVLIFKQQIEKGGPVTVTHPEIKRFFMAASEAAQLVMQAGAIGTGGEIFILDMGEQIKIADLARNLITLSGLEVDEDIVIKFTGLRPGEKMHEEMLLNMEHDRATKHDKIYLEQPEDIDVRRLWGDIKTLERMADQMDKEKIVEKVKEIVPNYHPEKGGRWQSDDRG